MAGGFEFRPFSRKQRQILTWWMPESGVSDYDGIIVDGAIRSGKTVAISLSYILWAMTDHPGETYAICGKTIAACRRNVIQPLKSMLDALGYDWEDRRADNVLIVYDGAKRAEFWIFGGRDERSQDLIQGITLAGVYLDEIALMPRSFVDQAVGRCSIEGAKIWACCNPAGPRHYIKTDWIDKAEERRLLHLHTDMTDNLSLSQSVLERYNRMYPSGAFRRRYILGEWAIAEGRVYDVWRDEYAKPCHIDPALPCWLSIDYGTLNPTACLLWQRDAQGTNRLIREWYYSGREEAQTLTDEQIVDRLTDWLGDIHPARVIVDPSAASFIAALRARGLPVKKANNSVLDGIRITAEEMAQGRILIDPSCTRTLAELDEYAWDEKAAERGEDKPLKTSDHCMDAMRYYIMTVAKPSGISVLK